jgi:hypothetical protein
VGLGGTKNAIEGGRSEDDNTAPIAEEAVPGEQAGEGGGEGAKRTIAEDLIAGTVRWPLKWVPKDQEGQEGRIADEHVVVEERGAEEHRCCEGVKEAGQSSVGGGDSEGLETRAEEGSSTGRYGGHDPGQQ